VVIHDQALLLPIARGLPTLLVLPPVEGDAGWLADLDRWTRDCADGNPADRLVAAEVLRHWQGDAHLGSVRHPWSLLRLSVEEPYAWQHLWTDVASRLRRADS
jgi:hypothetical protein